MQLHHTGYIVENADDSSAIEEGLHLVTSAIDSIQVAKICLYKNTKDEFIELVQPLNEKSPVWNFLQKKGSLPTRGGFHHECYEASLEEIEKYTTENKLYKIMGPVPAVIFNNRMVLFYMNQKKRIIEFII